MIEFFSDAFLIIVIAGLITAPIWLVGVMAFWFLLKMLLGEVRNDD